MLKQKVKDYLEVSGISKCLFCRRIGISTNHLYGWLKGKHDISDDLANRIQEYLDKQSTAYSNL